MMKAVAVSPWCLLGVLYICATADATSVLPWETAGVLPCGDWDCKCAFNQQRGCCCASNDLFSLETSVFTRLMAISGGLTQLQGAIEDFMGGQKVAFTATLNHLGCFGPFTSNVPIPYNNVTLNHGNGYNSALGAFTAPHAGFYSFAFTAFSDVRLAGERMYHQVRLMKNGAVIASVWEDNREDSKDSATQSVLLQLDRGSQVYVDLVSGRQLCDHQQNHNAFSGYLVYPSH
ncbi:cerebellin 18 [Anguilla rostrata]|uniref:cerebellin 18 n=1 Tax=Anguilla rostrata TaxID=7938 RepID=UPI0030CB26F8